MRAPSPLWSKLLPIVRENRTRPTPAEEILWQSLRRQGLASIKFRRQHVIERYVADFYCARARLVIEVDGPIHQAQHEDDRNRQEFLESLNLRVLRFKNDEVLVDLPGVLVNRGCSHLSPCPRSRFWR